MPENYNSWLPDFSNLSKEKSEAEKRVESRRLLAKKDAELVTANDKQNALIEANKEKTKSLQKTRLTVGTGLQLTGSTVASIIAPEITLPIFAVEGFKGLIDENGIRRTIGLLRGVDNQDSAVLNKLKETGEIVSKPMYRKAALSGLGDIINLSSAIIPAFKPKFNLGINKKIGIRDENAMFRVVDKNALQDAVESRVIRGPKASNISPSVQKDYASDHIVNNLKFEFPYFSKRYPYYDARYGREIVIKGGKNTKWTPIQPRLETVGNQAQMSLDEILEANAPFATPFNNGKINSGKVSDFMYYDINRLNRFVPRTFDNIHRNPNEELIKSTYVIPTAIGVEYRAHNKRKSGGKLNYLNYINNVGRTI